MKRIAVLICGWLALISASPAPPVALDLILGDSLPPLLSDFHFFAGKGATKPNDRVNAYALNTPLFSDYAEKFRFIYIPPGKQIGWTEHGVLDFPIGSVLIKSFGYPADARTPDKDVTIIETRLLIRRASGWVALPYIWNAALGDAELKRGGRRMPVSWVDRNGMTRTISYAVPNQNQCKECHAVSGAITPIGPTARNLNNGIRLEQLYSLGLLDKLPANAQRLPRWDDVEAPIANRARAYLDVNCAHCHNPNGAASNSGLFLGYDITNPVTYGVERRPTAAGRGSGNLEFDIDPGHPDRSILLYRMKSIEPGIAMPELGRDTVHDEAVALLEDWIRDMPVQK